MSRLKSTVKAAKNLADRANLRTGLAVTKPGPATTRRVKKRGRNVNVAAGAGAGAAGIAAASGSEKPKAKAKPSRRGPSLKEAGAKIKKSKEAFERRKRSNRQAESAMRSVQKSRALGEAAARDPKATKPTPPKAPPTTSVKPPRADRTKVTSGATKPTPSKARTTPKVSPPPKVTKRPTVTGGGTTMASRNVTREGPMGKRTLANVTREQLVAAGLTTGPKGLKTYLNKFDELGRRPKPSDFKKTKEKASKKRTTSRVGSPASGPNRRPKPAGKAMGGMMKSKMASKGGARGGKKMPGGMKNGGLAMTTVNGRKVPAFAADGKGSNDLAKKKNGGMMKPKGMRRGGRVMAEPAMPTPPSRRRRGTPTPPPNPNLTAADKKLRASLSLAKRGNATPSAAPSLGDIVRRGGKIPTKTPTPNIDGATRRRGKTPNMPPMPKIPGGMKNGGMAKKGYAKGGMAKKGYSKGGAVRGKPRGVGVALRGYGKALKK